MNTSLSFIRVVHLCLFCRSYGPHGQVSTYSGTQHSPGNTVSRTGKNTFFSFYSKTVHSPISLAVLQILCALTFVCSLQSWSNHLERWARYVIRCEIEYPGPIDTFTNFGKLDRVSRSHTSKTLSVGYTLDSANRHTVGPTLDIDSRLHTREGQ